MKYTLMAASMAFFTLTTAASAATLTINDGVAGTIPSTGQTNEIINDLYGDGSTLSGFFDSYITISGDAKIFVEFYGFEAGYQNSFVLGGQGFNSETYSPDNMVLPSQLIADFGGIPSFFADVLAGDLDFTFFTNGLNNVNPDSVTNNDHSNANTNQGTKPNFFASFGDSTTTSGDYLWLYFDDGGANDDDNHDDFAILITTVVPLPGAALPLLTALGGLGFVARRRRKA